MQDFNSKFHVKTSSWLFAFNVLCLGVLTFGLLFLNHFIFGLALGFVTLSFACIGLITFLKYNTKFVNEFSSLPIIIEQALEKSNLPIIICVHRTIKGKPCPKVLFANDAYLNMKNTKLTEIVGKETQYMQEVSETDREKIYQALEDGNSVSAKIIDKDSSGRWIENELNLSPIRINNKLTYWVGFNNFVQYVDTNIISLSNQSVKALQPKLD